MTTRQWRRSAEASFSTWRPPSAKILSPTSSEFLSVVLHYFISERHRMPEDEYDNSKKAHVKRKSGKKAEKKKGKEGHEQVGVFISSDLKLTE